MRRFALSLIMLCLLSATKAQQEFHTTLHIFAPQLRQVAYSGTQEELSLSLIHSNQWKGFDGNPKNTLFSGHFKIKDKGLAIGSVVNHERCGIKRSNAAELIFSYGLTLKNVKLAFGIGSAYKSMKWDISDLSDGEISDLTFLSRSSDCRFFSFRTGIFVSFRKIYFGATLSNLNRFKTEYYTQKTHCYLSSGYKARLSQSICIKIEGDIQAERLTGYTSSLSATLAAHDNLFVGLSYRTSKNIGFHVKANICRHLYAGAAYEHAAGALKESRTAATFEFLLGFRRPLKTEPPANWDKDRLLFY